MTLQLATPYILPYEVKYEKSPLLSLGRDLYVHLLFANDMVASAIDDVDDYMAHFCTFSCSGAYGGAMIPPGQGHISVSKNERVGTRHVRWMFPDWKTDERALVLLSQWLLACHQAYPIREICFSSDITPPSSAQTLTHDPGLKDPYPPYWQPLPFAHYVDDYFYEEACLTLELMKNPAVDQREEIETEILSWAWSTMDGMYPIAPLMPSDCSMLYDEEDMEWVDNKMEFPFTKFRAHTGAISGLLNICATIHHNVLPIIKLTIE